MPRRGKKHARSRRSQQHSCSMPDLQQLLTSLGAPASSPCRQTHSCWDVDSVMLDPDFFPLSPKESDCDKSRTRGSPAGVIRGRERSSQ